MKVIFLPFTLFVTGLVFSCGQSNEARNTEANLSTSRQPFVITLRQKNDIATEREFRNTSRIKSVNVLDQSTIWIGTDFKSYKAFFSENGGLSWTELVRPNTKGIQCLTFLDRHTGWLIDLSGNIWQTKDRGKSWEIISSQLAENRGNPKLLDPTQLIFLSKTRGFIVDLSDMFRTDDGGLTWKKVLAFSKEEPEQAFFRDESTGWIITYYKEHQRGTAVGGIYRVYKTEDAGVAWRKVSEIKAMDGVHQIFFLNHDLGWLTREYDKPLTTKNGGTTWKKMNTPIENFVARSTFWRSKDAGWITGYTFQGTEPSFPRQGKSALFHTVDGGLTWKRQYFDDQEPFFDKIYFADDKDGWLISREKIYRTNDGGENWKPVLQLSFSDH